MFKEELALVPHHPGCYLMKNSDGNVIYVGKSKNLKNRLSSYFRSSHTGKTAMLVRDIAKFEYILTSSNLEALLLEINLIKKYNPKYNILLRDDKTYPYIELTNEKIPKLSVVRSINRRKNKNTLYGPFPNVTAARNTVNLLNRMYPLRKCNKMEKKPCLYYHIGECLGYCQNKIDEEKVELMKSEIKEFLNGNDTYLKNKIKTEMIEESEKLNFEKAKELKELLDYIEITLTKQKVETGDYVEKDVFGYYIDKDYMAIQVFFIRNGKILERHSKILPIVEDEKETLETYIVNFYQKVLIPKEILVPDIVDENLLKNVLNTKILKPQKGVKFSLIKMACENAKIELENNFELIKRNNDRTYEANESLRKILKLDKLDRIEIFDNAHLFGTFNVSGMVVFEGGIPNKNEYRKYKSSIDTNDDYRSMREVTYRRYYRVLMDDLKKPDLIIADGGIGQIHAIREILEELNLNIMVVGLKKNERHITEALLAFDPIEEIPIDKKSNLFYLLERMQDEVHNFTINYHKQIRSKGVIESILDKIPGIGKARKEALLHKYKTINKIKEASIEELSEILPEKTAIMLLNVLKNDVQ